MKFFDIFPVQPALLSRMFGIGMLFVKSALIASEPELQILHFPLLVFQFAPLLLKPGSLF